MITFKNIVAACALASTLAATTTLSARAGGTYVAPGAFFGNGSGFGGNLSTEIAPLGGSATLRGAATLATDNHSTAFGVGLDAIAHSEGVYYGAGANVFFPSCSECRTNFQP